MFRYDYIAVVDIDEVIMPQQHNSWHEMIKEINKTTPVESNNISTFVFRHALFQDKEGEKLEVNEDIPVWLHMMNHVYRSVKYFPPRYNVKSIHRTERTQVVFNHYALSCIGQCKEHNVDPSLGRLQHYRRGCTTSITKEDCRKYYEEKIKDTAVWRIKDQVIANSLTAQRNINYKTKRGETLGKFS